MFNIHANKLLLQKKTIDATLNTDVSIRSIKKDEKRGKEVEVLV